jgi:hypothetical protein
MYDKNSGQQGTRPGAREVCPGAGVRLILFLVRNKEDAKKPARGCHHQAAETGKPGRRLFLCVPGPSDLSRQLRAEVPGHIFSLSGVKDRVVFILV